MKTEDWLLLGGAAIAAAWLYNKMNGGNLGYAVGNTAGQTTGSNIAGGIIGGGVGILQGAFNWGYSFGNNLAQAWNQSQINVANWILGG